MARTGGRSKADRDEVVESYIKGVRVVETAVDGASQYRFEAPMHVDVTFDRRDRATLYADVYFDVNGFREKGTGQYGVPPEIVQAGKDTLAAYLIAHPATSKDWVASFYGTKPERLDQYVQWVRERAQELRAEARAQGAE